MRLTKWSSLVAATAIVGVAACSFDEPTFAEEQDEEFIATLAPANEIPAVTSPATGMAWISIVDDTILTFRLDVANIDSTRLAHIHQGNATTNGPVLVTLFNAATVNCRPNAGAAMTIVNSSVGNPTTIAVSAKHGRTGTFLVRITGHTGSTPGLDGVHTATVTGDSLFTVPVNVTVAGTGGTAQRFTLANTTSPRCIVNYSGFVNQQQAKFTGLPGTTAEYAALGATARERFDALVNLLRTGGAYVNVHNISDPGGHMRGQVQAQ